MPKPISAAGDFDVVASYENLRRYNVTHRHTLIPAIKWLPRQAAIECCTEIAALGLLGKTVAELSASTGWLPAFELIKEKYMPLSVKQKERSE